MGWDYCTGKGPDWWAAKCTETQESMGGGTTRTLASARTPGVLWAVKEHTSKDGFKAERFIACYLLDGDGCKAMSASMHPYYYDCPLEFLEMVPEECPKWRGLVRQYHERNGRLSDRAALRRVALQDAARFVPAGGITED